MFKFHTPSKWLEDIHRKCLHKYKTKISSKTFFINPHIPSKHFPLQNYFPNRCPKLEKRLSSRFPTQSMDWKFFIEGKVTFEWIFQIQVSGALPNYRTFYHFVWDLAKTLTSDALRKFSMRRMQTFWVYTCIAFS